MNLTKEQRSTYHNEMRAAAGNMPKQAEIYSKWQAISEGKDYQPAPQKPNTEPLKVHCYRDHIGRLMLKIPESDPSAKKQPVFGFDILIENKSISDVQTILQARTESHGQQYQFDKLSYYEPETKEDF